MSTLGLIIIYPLFIVMLKRFFLLLILLTIAFFTYRKINPEWAQNLINKVNHIIGRDTVISSWAVLTGDIMTGSSLTGDEPAIAWAAAMISGGLLDTVDIAETVNTWTITWAAQAPTGTTVLTPSTIVTPPAVTPPKTTTTTTTTKTSTKPKTSSDVKDTQNLINSLFK